MSTVDLDELAAALRRVADEQQGFLWFEVGESALRKVADWVLAYGQLPRTWSLPAEPGPEVTAVQDGNGRRYEPTDQHYPSTGERVWRYWHDFTGGWANLSWRSILSSYGPVFDATPSPLSSAAPAPGDVGGTGTPGPVPPT